MTPPLRFSLATLPPLAVLGREWSAFDRAGGTSFFTSWLWIGTWLRVLPDTIEPLLLRANEAERTVAMAILVRRRHVRRLVLASRQIHFNSTGDERLDCLGLEHNGFATDGAARPGLWAGLLAWFASGEVEAEELVIAGVRDDIDTIAEPRLLHRIERVQSLELDLAGIRTANGEFGDTLSRNSRQQLSRALRIASESGTVAIEAARDDTEALQFFDAMKPLHIAHWTKRGKHHAFRFPLFEAFHRTLIGEGVSDGRVELIRVKAGQNVLGYLHNFRHGGRVYAYQSGFVDLDRRRPGYICHSLAVRRAALRGDRVYDFMAGANRLKRSFASREYAMGWHVVQRPLIRFRAENALRAAKQLVLQH